MKNHFLKYIFSIITLCAFSSCNDEFLERFPLDRITNETFWNTENDLAVYNNSIYDLARNDDNVPILMAHDDGFDSHRFGIWYLDEFSDNIAPRHSRHTNYQQLRAGKHVVPSSAGDQWYGYKGWNFIRSINIGLANYNRASIAQNVIDKYAAEARLFRGWFYADKVSKFGDAPWIDKELNVESEELYAARTPRAEVMENVLEDLNFAVEKLPNDWKDGNAPGRINRWGALAVKSRICLFEGTWRKYHGLPDAEKWLRESANAAEELINNGPYRIYSTGDPNNDYNSYHRVLDVTGNPEVIYWRKYKLGIFTNHVQSYHKDYNGGATKNMVEDYLCTDGLPISLSPLYKGDAQIEDVFENRDPRLRQTILHPEDKDKYTFGLGDPLAYPRLPNMEGGHKAETGYHIIKIYNAADMIGKAFNTAESPAIILRLGEVLLNYAEAKTELGELTQEVLDKSINLLRDRVGMPHMILGSLQMDPRYANEGISAELIEIRRERRVELFMEGFRYDDLRRWKQGKKLEQPSLGIRWDDVAIARYPKANVKSTLIDGIPYIDVYKGTDWASPVFDESKHYLWPIPLSELSQNPAIQQNPGW